MSRDVARIRNEYVEMPGLVLTLPQAARLWGLSESRSALLLSMLVETGFLICDKKTVYRRRLDRSEKRESDARPALRSDRLRKKSSSRARHGTSSTKHRMNRFLPATRPVGLLELTRSSRSVGCLSD